MLSLEQITKELGIVSKRIPGEGFVSSQLNSQELKLGLVSLKILHVSLGMSSTLDELIHVQAILFHRLAVDPEPIGLRHQGHQLVFMISNIMHDFRKLIL